MKIRITILVLAVVLLSLHKTQAFALSEGIRSEPVWWSFTGQEKTSDGGTVISLSPVYPDGMRFDDIEVVYISTPGKNSDSSRGSDKPEIYRKKVERPADASPINVQIYSGRTELIDLRGRFSSGERVCYAQCIFSCYGKSGLTDDGSERISDAPAWRSALLRMDDRKFFYRAQTGETITVASDIPDVSVDVFNDGDFVLEIRSDASGVFAYTPPHDKSLASAGYSAKKDIVFGIDLPEEAAYLSVSIPVYRAFYGNTSLAGGLSVLAASVSGTLCFVILRSRRFRWR
ncbi:MAG: hypothetical protein LBU13_10180 [Synergistaceae bacterium]|jgi:hypothetical protein|nr:hypothetical protein [Synergistaceae bacterium]